MPVRYATNDLPGCPKGGLLLGTDKTDELAGEKGDDEIRGLGGSSDTLWGGDGNDLIYGGPGNASSLAGDNGDDVIYGGAGNDADLKGYTGNDTIYGGPGDDKRLDGLAIDGKRDEIYCGQGRDTYWADKDDYVSSSCEKKLPKAAHGPSAGPICTKSFEGDVCRIAGRTASASSSPFSVPQVLADGGGPSILLPAAALLLGSGILTYAILRRR